MIPFVWTYQSQRSFRQLFVGYNSEPHDEALKCYHINEQNRSLAFWLGAEAEQYAYVPAAN